MISSQRIRSFFLGMSLAVILSTATIFGFGAVNSWAATSHTQIGSQSQTQILAMNRAETIAKNMEGKVQEAVGNITGDPKDRIVGKAKQIESQALNTAEDIKDKVKLKGRTKAVTKNMEGKVQEAKGKVTGNRKNRFTGKAKQVESQARNTVEDVKDNVRGIFK